jgi:DNA-binding CsgD family transcriptional regulator
MEWTWSDGMYRLHGADRESLSLHPGAGAILDRVVTAERDRVSSSLEVLDEADDARQQPLLVDYWVPSSGPIPRRIRLSGNLEAVSWTGGPAWVGCVQDVTDEYLFGRALATLEAAEDALRRWRSFAPSLQHLLGRLATALNSPRATAWGRGSNGRLEPRAVWSAPGTATGEPAEPLTDSLAESQQRALARTVWATRGPAAGTDGFGVPATWRGATVAALTFESNGSPYLDERLARTLLWIGAALGRRLTGDRPETGETRLSKREREVLQLAANGYDGPAIAEHLLVSPATVKTHFLHVYEKLGVNDRAGAVATALRQGLIA